MVTRETGTVQIGFFKDGTMALEVELTDQTLRIPISLDEAMILSASLNDMIVLASKGAGAAAWELCHSKPSKH